MSASLELKQMGCPPAAACEVFDYTHPRPPVTNLNPRTLGIGAALVVAYILAARLGFTVAFVAEQVTTVWAPTGLAQAALLLWGRSLWPAVWLGAFAVNAGTGAPLWTAVAIATGNTLEAVVAAWLLIRFIRFDPALERTRDGVAFILVAACVAPTISATIGVFSLCAGDVQPWARFPALWFDWWVGDAIGALVVGPVILTVARSAARRHWRAWIETGALVLGTAVVTQAVFGHWMGSTAGQHPLAYVIFPFFIAAAVRHGQPATALVVFAAAAVAIRNTIVGSGPFAGLEIHDSLVFLQLFMGVAAGTGLLLAAAVAERKTSEAAVVDEQRRTEAILETALDAIVGMDARGVITEFNPAAERTFGYTRSDAIGRELADLLIPPALRDSHREGLRRYLATGEGPMIDRRIETTAWHAEGHEFPVEVSITRVLDDVPPRFTGFVRDLTAQSQAARERERLLERELAARREAEDANRAKDEFLATLSHELRTPLNAIVGWTRMLRDGTLDESHSRRALEVIERNAHLQGRLVADILDVSGIITGGLTLQTAPLDLGAVIGAALEALGPSAHAKGICVQSRFTAEDRQMEGDAERLQQIVWNLVANAIKFTPAGGRVDVDLVDADQGTLRIRVRDDGAGIDPAFLPHVFDRFRQADGSASRVHGGLGLGLAIVRHLVELHGGRIHAESPGLGMGATFVVDLPKERSAGERHS